ncbi:hypothetical protein F383_21559 [Gossypium arboreum]|nr:hypothetical protein F383_21559 [Gossypium arboreum]
MSSDFLIPSDMSLVS